MSLVRTLRRRARSVLARLQRLRLRVPPLPARVDSLLFVCKGNICRSPFAAMHAAAVARAAGLTATSASAGLNPSQDNACPAHAIDAAAAYGLDLRPWRPVPLTDAMMASHDLVVVMELAQLEAVAARWPQHRAKTVLLSLHDPTPADGWEVLNIADPFGKDRAAFDACYTRIDRALSALFSRLHGSPR